MTAPPFAADAPRAAPTRATFVVLACRTPRRRFELSVKVDGATCRWALPKGLVLRPGERHLALEIDRATAEDVWDCGACEIREWTPRRVTIVLHGERLRGCFRLLRLPDAGPRHWLLISLRRLHRPPARPTEGEARHEKNPRRRRSV